MADLDRLTPSYKSKDLTKNSRGSVRLITSVQYHARSVVKKYRRNVRYSQLKRLKEMIPTLAQQEMVDEVGTEIVDLPIILSFSEV